MLFNKALKTISIDSDVLSGRINFFIMQVIKILLTCLFLLTFFVQSIFAQKDVQATKDLKQIKSIYQQSFASKMDFDLVIDFPEQEPIVQQGYMIQSKDSFRIALDQQILISDGITMWVYIPDNEEVQVYDAKSAEDDPNSLKPNDLFKIYDNPNFDYVFQGNINQGKKVLSIIEFKPLDKDSEFSKVRLSYGKHSKEVSTIKVFNKDGSRYTLKIKSNTQAKSLDRSTFVFDTKKHPNVSVEDMRL